MTKYSGISFHHIFMGETIKFTITRDAKNAFRMIINDTIQAIWMPKCFFHYTDGKPVRLKNVDWKLRSAEFQKKFKYSKKSDSYIERHGFTPGRRGI